MPPKDMNIIVMGCMQCMYAASDLAGILAARDRGRAGPTAPAHGLTLVRISYGGPPPGPSNPLTNRRLPGTDA